MVYKMQMPSENQYDLIAEALDGSEETYSKALVTELKAHGLDENLQHSPTFLDRLEELVFCCEQCDTWRETGVRVYNEIADMKMCESCDESFGG
ncbi:hypothetical protein Acj9p192 [Acinetobacter phage Acj9]|uniref:Uncharacterized protein n=1 Tax=Acinetobacter phage Acj9 TaxID=760939 RepID=E5EPX6_9CAUD|nr:hypothetical protein Acj9p192 [Acinetobacter phage Acj9]ADG60092.1 hypothetical protein Acj9p192 [Acinetobacter phage Acj9]